MGSDWMESRPTPPNPLVHYYEVTDEDGKAENLLLHVKEVANLERLGNKCVRICSSTCVGG